MELRAWLFGTLTVFDPQGRPLDLGSPTTRALLAYLLLHHREAVDRRRLAFVLWPRATESAARRNLRQYLHHLRQVLMPLESQGEWIVSIGSTLAFHPQVRLWLDSEAFEYGVRPEAGVDEALEAVRLYRGDLLEDVYEDWCQPERDRLRRLYLHTLDRLTQALAHAGRVGEAIPLAQKWVALEPLDEQARRRLMTLYALHGERGRALAEYQQLVRVLEEEIGAEPLPETQALFQSLQRGEFYLPVETPPAVVIRRSAPKPRLPAAVPLVDRQHELAMLEQRYERARQGEGRLILLAGEAGIGKTRLIHEYLARHPQAPVLQSVCYELESMQVLAPLRQALEENPLVSDLLLAMRPQTPPWLAPLLAFLPRFQALFPYVALPAMPDAQTLREALIQFFLDISRRVEPPLHLVLDDLHWADTLTWEWLVGLTRQLTTVPLLVFGLYRREDLPADRQPLLRLIERSHLALTFTLPPLSPEDTVRLAAQMLPAMPADAIFRHRLYQETEGNPFFIIEAVKALQESRPEGRPPLLTTSIQEVLQARIERLSPTSREALAAAAAIGRPFSLSLLHSILDRPREELVAELENWEQRGLIHEVRQGYDFRHDKMRQVAYNSLSRARREYIHGRIAEVLENSLFPVEPATLAYHYTRSDRPWQALPYLTRAGEQALQMRSYQEARQFGLQAVNLLGQMGGPAPQARRIDLNLQLAQAYAFSGNLSRAIAILSETEHLAHAVGEESRLGAIFRRAAQCFWLRGQPAIAGDYARRALRVAEEQEDLDLLSSALRMVGRVSIALAAFDDAIAYLLRYVHLHEERHDILQMPLPPDLPIVLGYLGVAYARVGAWERALSTAQRGVELARAQHGETHPTTFFAYMQWGMVQAARHDWEAVLKALAPIPELTPDELSPPTYMALSLRGLALAHRGAGAEGLRLLTMTTSWAEHHDHRVLHYVPRLFLAEAYLLARQLDRAQHEARRAHQEAVAANNRWATAMALRLLAEIGAQRPQPGWSQIEQDLLGAMHLLRAIRARPDLARVYLALRRLYDRAGQLAWAVDCHFRATTIFEELGMIDELRQAQGQAAYERSGAVVIPGLPLRGPNAPALEEG